MKQFFLFFFLSIAFLSANEGKVTFVIGTVDIQKDGESQWTRVTYNQRISNGDRIRTRLQSRCELRLPDESTIKIEENTVFEVKILDEEKEEEFSFFLWLGNVSAKFKKIVSSRQSRTIESPSAVVAVRGTEFSVAVDQGRRTILKVKSGKVEYMSKATGKKVIVKSNQFSSVAPGKDPTPPQRQDDEGGREGAGILGGAAGTGEGAPGDGQGGQEAGGQEQGGQQGAQEGGGQGTGDQNAGGQGTGGQGAGTGGQRQEQLTLNIDLNKFVYTEPSILGQGLQIKGSTLPGAQVKIGATVVVANSGGLFSGYVNVREGLNVVDISARKDGQFLSSKVRVYVNTSPPKLNIKRPVNSRFTNVSRYNLEGTINDATPMDEIELILNSRKVGKFAAKSSFRIPLVLKEGLNEFALVAQDRSGNTESLTESLFLDSIKPQIVINRPATSGMVINIPPNPPSGRQSPRTVVVTGRVIDPQPSSGLETVSVNGAAIQLSPNGQFETPIQLHLGTNELIFNSRDRAGNVQRVTRTIVVKRGN